MKNRIDLTDTAKTILTERILAKKDGHVIETPEQMFWRVATCVADAEALYNTPEEEKDEIENDFYDMLSSLKFLPNSPTLVNAGREIGMLSGCFVLPVPDSMEGIAKGMYDMVMVQKAGGGTGFSFSRLRPEGALVSTTNGTSSGPVSFMHAYNAVTDTIKQGGVRRGANMCVFSVHHPDILKVVVLKQKGLMKCVKYAASKIEEKEKDVCFHCEKKDTCDILKEEKDRIAAINAGLNPDPRVSLTNFNISISVTNKFMEAVIKNELYDLIDPVSNKVVKRLPAKDVFKLISLCAWNIGCPGLLFIDEINKYNPTPHVGEIEATNPCGEQPLLAYESCNLGSISLDKHLYKDKNGHYQIDYDALGQTVTLAIRFLDNIIDINKYPLPEIEKNTKGNRKIGLGVMGFAEILLRMGIKYGSAESVRIAEEVSSFIQSTAKIASISLAEKRGTFPNFKGSVYDNFTEDQANNLYPLIPKEEHIRQSLRKHGIRNAAVTTIAPTGTLYRIANTTSGIEPIFAPVFISNILDGKKIVEVNKVLKELFEEMNIGENEIQKVAEAGTLDVLTQIPKQIRELYTPANSIRVDEHVAVQQAFQKHTDNAVSKTINLEQNASVQDVENTYLLAYHSKTKGITIYRDKSHYTQVLDIIKQSPTALVNNEPILKRPKVMSGQTFKDTALLDDELKRVYITINHLNNVPYEIFVTAKVKDMKEEMIREMISRFVSILLRYRVPIEVIVSQLLKLNNLHINSLPVRIANALKTYIKSSETCKVCGGTLEFSAGCYTCLSCGYSKCG